jgi:hypothetical protein
MEMAVSRNQNLTVKFGDCNAGWISMLLTSGERSLTVRMSHFLDPLPKMLAWLESIAIGVEECGFRVDEEGAYVNFLASKQFFASHECRAYTILNVTPQYDVQPLQVTLPTYDLVGIFYRAFREFADSPEYVRTQWEYLTLEQVMYEQSGMTASAWIDSVISLEPRQLQMALWRLDPQILNPEDWLDFIGTEAELMELTGKTIGEAGGLPCYWPLPQELWGQYANKDELAQRKFLEECLPEQFGSWSGTPWRRMRSALIENWLESESLEPWAYWKRWLT